MRNIGTINFSKKILYILLLVLIICNDLSAQQVSAQQIENDFSAIDEYARTVPDKYENDPLELTQYLIKPVRNEMEKIRSIFIWITDNILYDDNLSESDPAIYEKSQAMYVLQSRKAVCEGYANVFKILCGFAGVDCYTIHGYGKGYEYKRGKSFKKENHTWNVIDLDDKLHQFDVTWASGHDHKGITIKEYNNFWWDTPPEIFITTHFTDDLHYNNLTKNITKKKV